MEEKQLAIISSLVGLATAIINLANTIASKKKAPKRKHGKHKR